jgi:hypothetical protein
MPVLSEKDKVRLTIKRESPRQPKPLSLFHAAEAYIFEHTGKVAKTQRGVRSEFTRPDCPRYYPLLIERAGMPNPAESGKA